MSENSWKRSIAAKASETVQNCSKTAAMAVFNKALQGLMQAVIESGFKPVQIRGFGSFRVVHRKERLARNPRTGEPCVVPARYAIKFTASDEWLRKLEKWRRDKSIDAAVDRAAGRKRPTSTAV